LVYFIISLYEILEPIDILNLYMSQQGQQIIHCQNCGGNKINILRPTSHYMMICFFLLIIPVIGWVILPFVFIYAFLRMLKSTRKMLCMECRMILIVNRDIYKLYKQYLSGKLSDSSIQNKKSPSHV
jgi:hypothetical protein